MKSPCEGCIVKAMCRVGCEELWKYHNLIRVKSDKHNRWAKRYLNCSFAMSVLWGISLLFGFVKQVDGTNVYKFGSVAFSFWWHTLGYTIPSAFFFISFMIQKRCQKKLHALLYHDRLGDFIGQKVFEEARDSIIKKDRGDMIP